jgi:hypothetical protein
MVYSAFGYNSVAQSSTQAGGYPIYTIAVYMCSYKGAL